MSGFQWLAMLLIFSYGGCVILEWLVHGDVMNEKEDRELAAGLKMHYK